MPHNVITYYNEYILHCRVQGAFSTRIGALDVFDGGLRFDAEGPVLASSLHKRYKPFRILHVCVCDGILPGECRGRLLPHSIAEEHCGLGADSAQGSRVETKGVVGVAPGAVACVVL